MTAVLREKRGGRLSSPTAPGTGAARPSPGGRPSGERGEAIRGEGATTTAPPAAASDAGGGRSGGGSDGGTVTGSRTAAGCSSPTGPPLSPTGSPVSPGGSLSAAGSPGAE